MDASTTPVLVVGAGPTGLTMACELARHGVPARVVDKLTGIVPLARATGIHSRTLELFQDLGVVDEILSQGLPVRGVNQFANGERLLGERFDSVDSPYPFTIALEQYCTEAALEALLERLGGRVERHTELVSLAERLDGVRATLRHSDGRDEIVETPWLVGCDGAHSRVRHLNHQRFPGETDPHQYAIADVVVEADVASDEIYFFLTDRGPLALFPLPRGRFLVVADLSMPNEGRAEQPTLAEIQALADERGPPGLRVSDPRWLGYFRINYRLTRHYRHGRTFLAGDAAHIHSLIGGQGMNTGIQDAYNLAWKLALVVQSRAPVALLDSYEPERRAVAEDVVATTRRATDAIEAFRDLSSRDRDRLYRHSFTPPAELARIQKHREELDLDYRRSPICAEHDERGAGRASFAGGPHAGSQALDAGPLRLGDRQVSLFELLQGPRHSLLVFLPASEEGRKTAALTELAGSVARSYGDLIDVYAIGAADPIATDLSPPVEWVSDPEQTLRRRYGVESAGLYLIRPDAYVGYRSSSAAPGAFREYLERIFVPAEVS
jgi:2-polyprenyl-6-methoxyphenol hydroxylase-like FAD-dependent oxidoreductase